MTNNPLLVPVAELIDYAAVTPDHIQPAVSELIDLTRKAVEQVANPEQSATWASIIEPVQDVAERLWRAWSVAGHLNAVVNTPELRAAYNDCLPLVTEFSTWVGLHSGLYAQYKRLQASPDFAQLPAVRQRIIELALRDFRLSGVELVGTARERYAEISDQQAQASQKFSENALDSVDQWSLLITDKSRVAGLPADVVQAAHDAATADQQTGWKFSLKMPCYIPVMQYALDRELRQDMYRGYATIASEQGKPELDNSALIEQLLALRAEEAKLLGYSSFADLRLETRMADSADQVLNFLRELAQKAKPWGQRDLAELQEFASQHLDITALQPWDIAFASERLREQRYAYSEEEVKQYFTEPQVLNGLFHVARTLFKVDLVPANIPTWHADVRPYTISTANGDVLGHLYLDLYARQGKQSGAWVDSERNRRKLLAGSIQTPVVYLTCNFTPPQSGKPALLSHDDVITLFHESGHALHALLSKVDDPGASAFSAVEWDAIELPSQFMENFCWEWSVVQAMSAHVDTGATLPRELFNKLVAARNFQSGMQMLRQIEFSLFDMSIHQQAAMSIQSVMATLDTVRQEVAVLFPPSWHRFPHNFSHLFAGGYGAGYYSYKWAEVLSADAYAAFEENAVATSDGSIETLDPITGLRFMEEILAVGGARPAAESFRAFRGRDPSIDALLRHSGLAVALS